MTCGGRLHLARRQGVCSVVTRSRWKRVAVGTFEPAGAFRAAASQGAAQGGLRAHRTRPEQRRARVHDRSAPLHAAQPLCHSSRCQPVQNVPSVQNHGLAASLCWAPTTKGIHSRCCLCRYCCELSAGSSMAGIACECCNMSVVLYWIHTLLYQHCSNCLDAVLMLQT